MNGEGDGPPAPGTARELEDKALGDATRDLEQARIEDGDGAEGDGLAQGEEGQVEE